jgi:hypothetical protein
MDGFAKSQTLLKALGMQTIRVREHRVYQMVHGTRAEEVA